MAAGSKDQIGGIFQLHQAPVIGLSEHVEHRAALRRIAVEHGMQPVGRKPVGDFLGARPVGDAQEGVVGGGEIDALRLQPLRQPTVAVAVELQPERRPGRHAQIDQAEFGVHEVEIVVQTFAAVRTHEGFVRRLVMPGLIAVTGFHRRYHMHQAGMLAALFQHLGDDLLLADVTLGDMLDRDPRLRRHGRRPLRARGREASRQIRDI